MFLAGIAGGAAAVRENGVGVAGGCLRWPHHAYAYVYNSAGRLPRTDSIRAQLDTEAICYQLDAC